MSNSPIEEIKNRLDIVEIVGSYVKLEKAGANYRGLCPFHSEKTPSFFVSPSRQIWHCFGACSEGGDIFKFIMKIEGVEFGDALRILAKKAGVELKREDPKIKTERQRLYEISELACKFFETQIRESSGGRKAKEYLLKRGVSEESIKEWRIGYAPDTWRGLSDFLVGRGYKREEAEKAGLSLKSAKTGNYYDRFRARIIFPIFNLSSYVIGFGGRIMDTDGTNLSRAEKEVKGSLGEVKQAKYINSPATSLYDKSRILYGLNKASVEIRKRDACILVEGYMDAVMAHQAGLKNTVAVSGTALTDSHLKILKRYSNNILAAFDMDSAGNSATKKSINLAQNFGFNVKIVEMPQGADPADVVKESPEKMRELVEKAKSIHNFYFENVISKIDKNSIEGKRKISKILLPIIKKISNKIEQSVWIRDLAETLNVSEESIIGELDKISFQEGSMLIRMEREKGGKGNKKQKTRKELLEENLIILLIKFPEYIRLLTEEYNKLFTSDALLIIDYIKKNGVKIVDDISDDLKNKLNYFFLKADIDEIGSDVSKKEFENCLTEIKKLAVKEKLGEISLEIKKAEKEKDFERVNSLMQKFSKFSKL